MSLSTISHSDQLPKQRLYFKQGSPSLQTADIKGAQPRLPGYKFINKPEFSNYTGDIAQAQPAKLHPSISRPMFSLMTHDIDYAQPCSKEFKSTRTGQPMEPVYNLPKFEVRPYTPPKFIRDSIDASDIQGTRPEAYFKWSMRDHIGVADIEGSRPTPEVTLNKVDFTDPRDINRDGIFKTTRTVNPLMPVYTHRGEDGKLTLIGEVEGSQPRPVVRTTTDPHNRHLITSDIEGAKTGTVGIGAFRSRGRRNPRSSTDISDIEGAKAGSLARGIRTLRQVSPVSPEYTLPGASAEKPATSQTTKQDPKQVWPADPAFTTSLGRFYGTERVLPKAVEVAKSPPNRDFELASKKFYLDEGELSPLSKELELQKATEQFYSESPPLRKVRKFEQFHNPETIHRVKPRFSTVDIRSKQYLQDANKFFEDSANPSSRTATGPLVPNDTPSPVRGQASTGRNTDPAYHFRISRDQIKAPSLSTDEHQASKSPGYSGYKRRGSRSTVLMSSAKSTFAS
jgi:hypothetical protein